MDLSLSLPSSCCCCCGATGCGWVEPWANLNDWVVVGTAYVFEGHFTAYADFLQFGIGSRTLDGGYSISAVLTPGAEDTTVALLISDPTSGFSAPIIVGQQWSAGDVIEHIEQLSVWSITGTLIPVPVTVAPSSPEGPQAVTVQWNAAGEWSVIIGDAAAATGTGLGTLSPVPTQALVFASASSLEGGAASAIGPVTVACVELPPLPAPT